MPHRNDHEAALARAAALERELAAAERRAESKDEELQRLRAELAEARSTADRHVDTARAPAATRPARPAPTTGHAGAGAGLPWNRTFGAGIAIAAVAVGIAAALKLQDPGDPSDWSRVPWWLGFALMSPVFLFGLAFVVNRTYWDRDGGDLVVSNRPIPVPRPRRYPLASVEGAELRHDRDSDRHDIVLLLRGADEPAVVFRGVRAESDGHRACASITALVDRARSEA